MALCLPNAATFLQVKDQHNLRLARDDAFPAAKAREAGKSFVELSRIRGLPRAARGARGCTLRFERIGRPPARVGLTWWMALAIAA